MPEIFPLLRDLCGIMSVSGHEARGKTDLDALISTYFDEHRTDHNGNHIFIKRCGKTDAPRLMLDAHFDEVGMLVTGIHDGGLLSVAPVGGLDRRILPAAEVTVYGTEEIYGVIAAVPPHLQKPGDSKKAPAFDEIRIDTGYDRDMLEKITPVGTPVGFRSPTLTLFGDTVCGRGFDNKACCAAVIAAVAMTPADALIADIYVTLSSREEVGRPGGCALAAAEIMPDMAIVTDTDFGAFPGVESWETIRSGDGAALSLSAVTDHLLTRRICDIADKNNIPYQTIVEAEDTGTNATLLTLVGDGIPTAVISVPIMNMHTYNEVLSLGDIRDTAALISAVISSPELLG